MIVRCSIFIKKLKMKYYSLLACLLLFISCKNKTTVTDTDKEITPRYVWEAQNDSLAIAKTQELENARMHLKLINAQGKDKNEIWKDVMGDIVSLPLERIKEISPLVLEQDIPTIQGHIKNGKLNYEELTIFYLDRIVRFESDPAKALNAVISLNPNAVAQARKLDKEAKDVNPYSVYGMPILLKDNIGTEGMKTTAGAIALQDNMASDAFITERLEAGNAIILGKANLSEWAYFLCSGCPVGYSAVGGQTINPYGRLQFESGGSSSGSGASIAANYAVAAIGTETSGSILSPSSQNNLVGLKPTIGLLSRSGIVPISSHLDTPGPMTKNVIDNAIVLQALQGKDAKDSYSFSTTDNYINAVTSGSLEGVRMGYIKAYMSDTLYMNTIEKLKQTKATLIEVDMQRVAMPGFLSILNKDMEADLVTYYNTNVATTIPHRSIEELVAFNKADTTLYVPYGQQLFEGILIDSTSSEGLKDIKENLMEVSRNYFAKALSKDDKNQNVDVLLSINNFDAGYAAVAHYPVLTIPMGFSEEGEPKNITLIVPSKNESLLYKIGVGIEQKLQARKLPKGY